MPINIYTLGITLLCISLLTRLSPLLIGNFLQKQAWAEKISRKLPCMILTLLFLLEIEVMLTMPGDTGLAVLMGITLTFLTHYFLRQIILSLTIGVVAFAIVQHFF